MEFLHHKTNVFCYHNTLTVIEVEKSNKVDVYNLHRCKKNVLTVSCIGKGDICIIVYTKLMARLWCSMAVFNVVMENDDTK